MSLKITITNLTEDYPDIINSDLAAFDVVDADVDNDYDNDTQEQTPTCVNLILKQPTQS